MMIWVHGFLMPERGETETRIFFLMGTDPRIDGSIDRQNNRNKKAGLKARKKIQFSDLQSPLCATKLMRAGRWWGWRSADTAYPALGSFPASCYHCRCLGFQGPKDSNSTIPCSVRHLAFRLPLPAGGVVVLGCTVEGCGVLPGVGLVGELEPGAVGFGVPLGEPDPGAVCGVVDPVGGLTLPVGGAVERGAELCRALPEPPAGAAPPGELWATAQLAQHNTTDSKVSLGNDIFQILQAF